MRVVLLDHDHIETANVGVDRHEVLGEIDIRVRADAAVEVRLLEQRHADALHDAAEVLAARGFGVEDAAAGERAHHPPHPHQSQIRIDADLGEVTAERVR